MHDDIQIHSYLSDWLGFVLLGSNVFDILFGNRNNLLGIIHDADLPTTLRVGILVHDECQHSIQLLATIQVLQPHQIILFNLTRSTATSLVTHMLPLLLLTCNTTIIRSVAPSTFRDRKSEM
jgi:hypothetical protein